MKQLNGLLQSALFDVSAEPHVAVLVKRAGEMIGRAAKLPGEPDDGEFGIRQLGMNPLSALPKQRGIV